MTSVAPLSRAAALALTLLAGPLALAAQSADPAARAAELLAADRALGAAAPTRSYREAFAALFADDAIVPSPAQGRFAEGREQVLELLLRDTLNARSRVAWQPVRAGVSADGSHGITIGVMSVTRPDGQTLDFKYLAYWQRGAAGWRAQVWRRVPRASGEFGPMADAPWLPRLQAPRTLDGDALARARRELQGMEQVFSDSAARVGIGPAFEALGADDAWHLGAPTQPGFTRGNRVIAQSVQGNAPPGSSPVTWSAERAILAPSGDLGVTLGYIVPNQPGPDGTRRPFPFFTIWRREAGGWKYIAE